MTEGTATGTPEFRRIGIVAKARDLSLLSELRTLIDRLADRDIEVQLDTEAASMLGTADGGIERPALAATVDLLVVLGGDGTLLSIARFAAAADVPVLGVNYGSLGFLTSTPRNELIEATESVLDGRYVSSSRSMLRAELAGAARDESVQHDVLNDAVINKTDLARIVELSATVNDDLVSSFAADGLIICTTTGSTAYSLAAGGPIVMPEVDAIVLTPICPHTLTNRPLVLPGSAVVQIRHDSRDQEVILTLDGQAGFKLQAGETVTIQRSPRVVRLLQAVPRSYFDILRTKLQWGAR